jgi:hypothetical protein
MSTQKQLGIRPKVMESVLAPERSIESAKSDLNP